MVQYDDSVTAGYGTSTILRYDDGELLSSDGVRDIFQEVYQIPMHSEADYEFIQKLCVRIERLEARPVGAPAFSIVDKQTIADNAFTKNAKAYLHMWLVDDRFGDWVADTTCVYFDTPHALKGYVKYISKKANLQTHRRDFLFGELTVFLGTGVPVEKPAVQSVAL